MRDTLWLGTGAGKSPKTMSRNASVTCLTVPSSKREKHEKRGCTKALRGCLVHDPQTRCFVSLCVLEEQNYLRSARLHVHPREDRTPSGRRARTGGSSLPPLALDNAHLHTTPCASGPAHAPPSYAWALGGARPTVSWQVMWPTSGKPSKFSRFVTRGSGPPSSRRTLHASTHSGWNLHGGGGLLTLFCFFFFSRAWSPKLATAEAVSAVWQTSFLPEPSPSGWAHDLQAQM